MARKQYTIRPKEPTDLAYQHTFATNADAVITLPSSISANGQRWVLRGVSFGYDDDPVSGGVNITGGGINYEWPVTSGGPGFLPIPPGGGGELSDMSGDVVITLYDGGSGVKGYLNVHAEEI